jgi:hypothetical protein
MTDNARQKEIPYMKLIAAISAFLFLPLAVMFGASLSQGQAGPVATMLLILLLVAGTSLVFGIIFGQTALRGTTICGGLALFVMWLPFQYYATEESLINSSIMLLLVISAQMLMFIVGGMIRRIVAARLRNVDNLHWSKKMQ